MEAAQLWKSLFLHVFATLVGRFSWTRVFRVRFSWQFKIFCLSQISVSQLADQCSISILICIFIRKSKHVYIFDICQLLTSFNFLFLLANLTSSYSLLSWSFLHQLFGSLLAKLCRNNKHRLVWKLQTLPKDDKWLLVKTSNIIIICEMRRYAGNIKLEVY